MRDRFGSYSYCYLNNIYSNEDISKLYEFVLSDDKFTKIALYRLTKEDFVSSFKNGDFDNLVKDFGVKDDYILCSSNVKVLPYANDLNDSLGTLHQVESDVENLYSFIYSAISYNFLFIDNCVVEEENWIGGKVTPFYKMYISDSTMTVMFKLKSDAGIYNRNIITLENHVLVFHDFYYAVPSGVSWNGNFVKNMSINNADYCVYRTNQLSIYSDSYLVSAPLINKAVSTSVKLLSIINLLDAYAQAIYSAMGNSSEELEWVGGTSDRRNYYGVTFKSNLKSLSKQKAVYLLKDIFSRVADIEKLEDAISALPSWGFLPIEQLAAKFMLRVFFSSSEIVNNLADSLQTIESLEKAKLMCNLFLYKVRTGCYLSRVKIASAEMPVLSGSDESSYTVVTEGLYYGL